MATICKCVHCDGYIGGVRPGDFVDCPLFCKFCSTQDKRDKMDKENVEMGRKSCDKCPMKDDRKSTNENVEN